MPNNKQNQNMGGQKRQAQKPNQKDQNIEGGDADQEREEQGNVGQGQDQEQEQRHQSGNIGGGQQRQGGKGSTNIEEDDLRQVGNDNDLDRDLDTEQPDVPPSDQDDASQQGQRQVDRDQGSSDRGRK